MDATTLAVVLVGLVLGWVLVRRTPPLPPATVAPAGGTDAHVVVIPARDEADVLPALLGDLAAQTRPARRVVVVDDGSTDGTATVARGHAGVEVRTGEPTPSGWNPKTWALHQGLDDVEEPVVVLLDADVRLAPDAVAAVLEARERHGGLVSVAPRHDTGSAVEVLSLPFNLVAVMGAGAGWSARRPDARAAFGPCLTIATDEYRASGGHAADRGELLDDVALARRVAASGAPVSLFRGGDRVRYRMYRRGARQILDGWTKNIAAGARRTPVPAALGSAVWITAGLVPLAGLVAAVATGSGRELLGAAAQWALVAASTTALARSVARTSWWAGLLAPVLAAVFVAVVARSAVALVLRRPVRWKGRRLVQARGDVAGG